MNKKQDKNIADVCFDETAKSLKDGNEITANKTGSVIISFDEYLTYLPPDHDRILREYKIEQFPDLFSIKNLDNDMESIVPTLHVSKPIKFFSALCDAKINFEYKRIKEKVTN